ncbi:MAG TPA: WYL domain-containing protein [Myxococcaceae bacterium]|nr:WYL domain-containing protein [Myxococcaceae bacterium]
MSDVHERLRRLLFVVPYVARHRGVTVDALARQLGVSREELLRDLELLTMVGRPPFQPDDFIDLHVENDQVWVDLDQRFSKPPRLTGPEAAALAAAAELLRPGAETALASALGKLERILPASAKKMYRELGSAVNARSLAPEALGILTRAVEERHELEFDYAARGSTAAERRRVEPVEVFNHRGQWYLYGWDLTRGSERLFRLDRMTDIRRTDRTFSARSMPPARVPDPAERGSVRVRFTAQAAPYLRERFGGEARELTDGGVEVKVAGEERWLIQWVLSFGGEAEVLEPAWAREAVCRAALKALEAT